MSVENRDLPSYRDVWRRKCLVVLFVWLTTRQEIKLFVHLVFPQLSAQARFRGRRPAVAKYTRAADIVHPASSPSTSEDCAE
jgi:hypothetical protein